MEKKKLIPSYIYNNHYNSNTTNPLNINLKSFAEIESIENLTDKSSEKINITPKKKYGISSFSLSSIREKKEWNKQNKNIEIDSSPEKFNQEDLIKEWNNYYLKKIENGEQNIASILKINSPSLKEDIIINYQVPLLINKVELEKELNHLVPFLKLKLSNSRISVNIILNQSSEEKKYIYTKNEKFIRLKEINPSIETLRKEFDLEI